MGIEPTYPAWKATRNQPNSILIISYTTAYTTLYRSHVPRLGLMRDVVYHEFYVTSRFEFRGTETRGNGNFRQGYIILLS